MATHSSLGGTDRGSKGHRRDKRGKNRGNGEGTGNARGSVGMSKISKYLEWLRSNICVPKTQQTGHVLLLIEELTKSVVEGGVVTETDNGYAIAGPVTPLTIPTTLHASLLARLDRLAPTREVAQVGAALGRQFSHELISAVAQMPQNRVDDALAQLVSAELIFRRGTPPDAQYTFKHALVQDAAYSTLLRSRRQQLHARIAAAFEERFSDVAAAQPELIAHHCAEAGLTAKAISYCVKAGHLALARSAMAEAATHLKKGLDLIPTLPDDAPRQQNELDLKIALGQALIATQGYATPAVGETFARSRQLCEQLGRPSQIVPVLYGQWVNHLIRGEMSLAHNLAAQMFEGVQAQHDELLTLLGRLASGMTCFWMGALTDARPNLERALGLCDSAHRAAYARVADHDPRCSSEIYLSMSLCSLGYLDQARKHRDQAIAAARTHAHTLALVLGHSVWYYWCVGDDRHLLSLADELMTFADERGFIVWSAQAAIVKGRSLALLGQAEEGRPLISRGLAIWRAMGAMMDLPLYLTMSAEAYARAGQLEEARAQVEEAIGIVEVTQARHSEAETHRVRGEVLAVGGRQAEAEKSFRAALAGARH
jgi:predicted ATPase